MIAAKRTEPLAKLAARLDGELHWDDAMRALYATDASIYRELPAAVCEPKSSRDIEALAGFARDKKLPLIPRTAGTSLAGQVVGSGIVVDVSKYWTSILELNIEEKWVRVQPGVVRDELNQLLQEHGLMFGPETSTSNRCMIGGMVGNNSCGGHSLVYGSTRDHLLEACAVLSDGSSAKFKQLSEEEFAAKESLDTLEGKIYRHARSLINDEAFAKAVETDYPRAEIHRRNAGYAIDLLLGREGVNLCSILAGSEGTLAFFTEFKLKLVALPPPQKVVMAVHLDSISEAARATLRALRHEPVAVELIDRIILDCASANIEQRKNLPFIKGRPGALLVVELCGDADDTLAQRALALEADLQEHGYGHHYPLVWNSEIKKVWALRNAGLGVLSNVPGDKKPVAGIEDTAVRPEDLPEFVDAFLKIASSRDVEIVSYAHIGDGEIHFRPLLDLKLGTDRKLYREICEEVATLVKRFRGSLSGEHGDGRARAEFISRMLGEASYERIVATKRVWDPDGIFNPGKIVDAPKIDESLRYKDGQATRSFDTMFDYSDTEGILRLAEKCNGTGVCRKTEKIGGTMCPSYMATRNEKDSTRARANILREFLTHSSKDNKFDHGEIKEVMDLCLSCKGCASECPSNVDVSKLKAEFLHQYYQSNSVPMRSRLIGSIGSLYAIGTRFSALFNLIQDMPVLSVWMRKALGFSAQRSLPPLARQNLRSWASKNLEALNPSKSQAMGSVILFCDEYTNYLDAEVGSKAIRLLTALGYRVEMPAHAQSARAQLSKGLLDPAKKIAERNVEAFKDLAGEGLPIVGIEPSAILGFRSEYPSLVDDSLREAANCLAKHALLIDEFLANEIAAGKISSDSFTSESREVLLHGHCHQKALSSTKCSETILSLPSNYNVHTVPSGCCGMAGAFGYEAEHYDLSMKVGELVLFPAVREAHSDTLIAATGTSCRHQIQDGVSREALHPVEILHDALRTV